MRERQRSRIFLSPYAFSWQLRFLCPSCGITVEMAHENACEMVGRSQAMKRILLAIAAFSILAAPAALAAPAQGKGHNKAGPPGQVGKQLPPGQAKKWRRGERLPLTYVAPQYYIEPRVYHLAPPPPGYRWVGVDGDAYLVFTTSGLVADVAIGFSLR